MASYSYSGLLPKIHPRAWVHPSAELLGDVEVAEDASIWPTTVLRGDNGFIHIGERSNVQDGSVCHATVGVSTTTVGTDVTVGHRVILHGCTIGNSCLVGMGAIVMDNVEVGDWSFIAAGSLLPPGKKYEPGSFILGSPARRIREVTEKERQAIVHANRVYVELARQYREGR